MLCLSVFNYFYYLTKWKKKKKKQEKLMTNSWQKCQTDGQTASQTTVIL